MLLPNETVYIMGPSQGKIYFAVSTVRFKKKIAEIQLSRRPKAQKRKQKKRKKKKKKKKQKRKKRREERREKRRAAGGTPLSSWKREPSSVCV